MIRVEMRASRSWGKCVADIEDRPDNTTRFLVIGRKLLEPSGHDKTSLLLSIKDTDDAGALQRLLAPLADHQVNMSRIESRPSRRRKWHYVFFVDIDGHADDGKVAPALVKLRKRAQLFRVLGSYPEGRSLTVPARPRNWSMRPKPDFATLAATGVRGLQPYVPGKPMAELEREYGIADVVKLASNENPLGPPEESLAAIQAGLSGVSRYPDGAAFELKRGLAAHLGVVPEQITVGNGSNEILSIIAETFLGVGDEAVYSAFAFVVYGLAVQATGATGALLRRPTALRAASRWVIRWRHSGR